jgi:hypothetical protein
MRSAGERSRSKERESEAYSSQVEEEQSQGSIEGSRGSQVVEGSQGSQVEGASWREAWAVGPSAVASYGEVEVRIQVGEEEAHHSREEVQEEEVAQQGLMEDEMEVGPEEEAEVVGLTWAVVALARLLSEVAWGRAVA